MLREIFYWILWFVFTFWGGYVYRPTAPGQWQIGPHFVVSAMLFLLGITLFPIKL